MVLPFCLVVLPYTQSTMPIELFIYIATYVQLDGEKRERLRLRVVGVGCVVVTLYYFCHAQFLSITSLQVLVSSRPRRHTVRTALLW